MKELTQGKNPTLANIVQNSLEILMPRKDMNELILVKSHIHVDFVQKSSLNVLD